MNLLKVQITELTHLCLRISICVSKEIKGKIDNLGIGKYRVQENEKIET